MNATRDLVPLHAADASTFCKNLRRELADAGHAPPSHLTLLNMLARSAGHRNFQTLRAAPPPAAPEPPPPALDATARKPREKPLAPPPGQAVSALVRKTLSQFDRQGRLARWPTQYSVQQLALWALWIRLPAKRALAEREVTDCLAAYNGFGDPVTLRRELINAGFMTRTVDCRDYRKVARKPDGDAAAFLTAFVQAARAAA